MRTRDLLNTLPRDAVQRRDGFELRPHGVRDDNRGAVVLHRPPRWPTPPSLLNFPHSPSLAAIRFRTIARRRSARATAAKRYKPALIRHAITADRARLAVLRQKPALALGNGLRGPAE